LLCRIATFSSFLYLLDDFDDIARLPILFGSVVDNTLLRKYPQSTRTGRRRQNAALTQPII